MLRDGRKRLINSAIIMKKYLATSFKLLFNMANLNFCQSGTHIKMAIHYLKPVAFDPREMTPTEHARLNELLDQLDTAVDAFRAHKTTGCLAALKKYLDKPTPFAHDYVEMYAALPDDRWVIYVEEELADMTGDALSADLKACFMNLSSDQQRVALAYASVEGSAAADASQLHQPQKNISIIYKQILSEFPTLLWSEKDIKSVLDLAETLRKQKHFLSSWQWDTSDNKQKIAAAKGVLADAFPNDKVDELYIGEVKIKNAAAAFLTSAKADVMILGPHFFNLSWQLPFYLLAHEFQHRRQIRLISDLESGKINKTDPSYYQARLFRANMRGGYISTTITKGFISRTARYEDYFNQPVERHANDTASYAHFLAGTDAEKLWRLSEKFSRAASKTAQPLDAANRAASRVVGAAKSIFKRR